MIEKYYEEELRYLYESGREFAKAHPDRANYLNIDSVGDRDPYVERLFEGFAFLTARIREKLDDTFPQLTEGLANLLWPQFLQEVPSLCIAQFTPRMGFLQESRTIPERSEIMSGQIGKESVVGKFTTTQAVVVNPIELSSVSLQSDAMNNETISFTFTLDPTVPWAKYNLKKIRLFLHAELPTALLIHRVLTTRIIAASVAFGPNGAAHQINPAKAVTPGGIASDESLLPSVNRAFWGYNLLREYFICPEKFLFVDLNGIDTVLPKASEPGTFTYSVSMGEAFSAGRQFSASMFRLHCCPVTNIFVQTVEPITKTGLQTEYRVIADSSCPGSMHVHSIRSVTGIDRISGLRSIYEPMYTFEHIGNTKQKTYATRFVYTPAGTREMDIMLSGQQLDNGTIKEESLVLEAWCTNGDVPRDTLREGEIKNPGRDFPDFVSIANITRPTLPFLPPRDDDLLWMFQAHLAATQTTLASKAVLKKFLSMYNWSGQEGRARRIESIVEVASEPMESVYKGSVVRGVRFMVTLEEQAFKDSQDMHLFGLVLSEFLGHYITINSFCELQFTTKPSGKTMVWNQIEGKRCLI